MKILVSNDDGIFALGIRTLANTLAAAGHEVTVVCPDRERSATGHGLTLHKPIRAEVIESVFHPQVQAWACSGTPSDCVKLALGALLDTPPDFVLSGINHGANLGTDVLYSGTVSAAMEGVIEGIPSVAFSLAGFKSQEFQPGANFARILVDHLGNNTLGAGVLLNVNIPPVDEADIQGVKITHQGLRRYVDLFEKRVDPRGKTYYWLAGEVMEEVNNPADSWQSKPESELQTTSVKTGKVSVPADVQAIQANYITITPLQYNLTSATGLSVLNQWLAALPGLAQNQVNPE
ncbi:5'/3'-nucleotidase SurE [Sphaerothrix gracilis]|uniref:5'/3'-nucleotidase SurE n=1 Tax=Sphaerothrix gracilis TaxID=3151835 RepID=UPI0031FC5C33